MITKTYTRKTHENIQTGEPCTGKTVNVLTTSKNQVFLCELGKGGCGWFHQEDI